MFKFLLLFTLLPALELYILIQVGKKIGVLETIYFIILTGVLGAYLAKQQGMKVLSEVQTQTAQQQMPAESLLRGFSVLVGGLLLITPGFLTDAMGFFFLLPISSRFFAWLTKGWFASKMKSGNMFFYSQRGFGGFESGPENFGQQPGRDPFAGPRAPIRDVTPKKTSSLDGQSSDQDE